MGKPLTGPDLSGRPKPGGSSSSSSSSSTTSSSASSSVWTAPIRVTHNPPGWGNLQQTTYTGSELMGNLYDMDEGELIDLQTSLWLNGFYGKSLKFDDISFGTADAATALAYEHLLDRAHKSGRSLRQILGEVPTNVKNLNSVMGRHGGSGGSGGGGRAVHTRVLQHTNPTDLEEAALQGFQAALGYAPSDEQKMRFVAGFHAQEDAAQPDTSGGGTFNVTDPASPQLAAKAMATKENPGDAQSYERVQKFGVILQALGVK